MVSRGKSEFGPSECVICINGPGTPGCKCYDPAMMTAHDIHAVLQWHMDAGCDETIGEMPINRFEVPAYVPAQVPASPDVHAATRAQAAATGITRGAKVDPKDVDNNRQVQTAMALAAAAESVDALRAALDSFDGCQLKSNATNLVFTDGATDARVMIVGNAPRGDEDRQGRPFVGAVGQFLDAMLQSIGLGRTDVLYANTVFWRPPGNRTPTPQEVTVCRPFIERLIEIVDPAILICVGAPAAHSLLGATQGIGRLRGKWFEFQTPKLSHPIAATALYSPDYLVKTPLAKRDAWQDLRMIRRKLAETNA